MEGIKLVLGNKTKTDIALKWYFHFKISSHFPLIRFIEMNCCAIVSYIIVIRCSDLLLHFTIHAIYEKFTFYILFQTLVGIREDIFGTDKKRW